MDEFKQHNSDYPLKGLSGLKPLRSLIHGLVYSIAVHILFDPSSFHKISSLIFKNGYLIYFRIENWKKKNRLEYQKKPRPKADHENPEVC